MGVAICYATSFRRVARSGEIETIEVHHLGPGSRQVLPELFWRDATSGVALDLKTGVPSYQVEDEEGRTHLLIHLPIEEQHENRWCLWRPDHAGFDSRSIFQAALIEK